MSNEPVLLCESALLERMNHIQFITIDYSFKTTLGYFAIIIYRRDEKNMKLTTSRSFNNDEIFAIKQKFYKIKKFIATLLLVGIFIGLFPTNVNVFANQLQHEPTPNEQVKREEYPLTTDANFHYGDVPITEEISSLRTSTTKTFRKQDGSYVVLQYGEVIHYFKNGKWLNIDNSLSFHSQSDTYSNKANTFSATFPKTIQNESYVQVFMGDYGVSWSIENVKPSIVAYSEAKTQTGDLKEVANTTQDIQYQNIQNGVDLHYTITGSKIKEDIILHSYVQNFQLAFHYVVSNLTLSNKNGVYEFVNKHQEPIFSFDPLYASDANGDITHDVHMIIIQIKEFEYKIQITVNDDWLKKATYPVIIDPTLTNSSSQITVRDAGIDQAFPYSNFSTATSMMISHTSSIYMKKGLINFDIPTLLTGKVITYASLSLTAVSNIKETSRTIGLYANNQTFDMSNITWDSYDGSITTETKMTDYHIVNSSNTYTFDITGKVKEWHASGLSLVPGFTIMDKNSYGARNNVYTLEYSQTSSRPIIEIGFIDPTGIKNYWTYSAQNIGLAGTGYVLDLAGTLTLLRSDIYHSSIKQSFGLSMIYSAPMKDVNIGYGYGWRTNYDITISYDNFVNRYAVIDASASKEYYQPVDTCHSKFILDINYHYFCYDAEDGSRNVLVVETDLVLNGHVNYLVWNPSDIYYRFNKSGYLTQITDTNSANQLSIYIQRETSSPYRIDYITDHVGNQIDLNYVNGKLSSAALYLLQDQTYGRKIAQTLYTIGASNQLEMVEFQSDLDDVPGLSTRGFATYVYDSTNILLTAETDNASKVSYSINPTTKRVDSITSTYNGVDTGQISYVYSHKKTVISNHLNQWIIYKFDDFGHTVNRTDYKGTTQSFQYLNLFSATDLSGSVFRHEDGTPNYQYNHSLVRSSSPTSSWTNPVLNGSFEFDLSIAGEGWTLVHDVGTYSGFTRTSSEKYVGNFGVSLGNMPSHKSHLEQTVTLNAGIYTLSAYVKNSTNQSGVFIDVLGKDYGSQLEAVPADNNWHLMKVLFVIENNSTQVQIALYNHANNGGTAYFDGIQIYEGFSERVVNLIENPSFEYAEGSSIPGWSGLSTGVTRTTLTYDAAIYATILGNYGIRIQGKGDEPRSYALDGQLIQVTSDVMMISGWAKSEGTPISKSSNDSYNRFFRLGVEMYTNNHVKTGETKYVDFDSSMVGWQYQASDIVMEQDASYLRIWMEYQGEGSVWFDNIGVYARANETLIKYEMTSNGARQIQIASPDKTESTYIYQDDDIYSNKLSKLIVDGKETTITRDNINEYKMSYDNLTYVMSKNDDGVVSTTDIGNGTDSYLTSSTETLAAGFGQYIGESTNPFGNKAHYEYDLITGLQQAIENEEQLQTRYFYDDFGNIIRVENGSSTTSTVYAHVVYGYDSFGRIEKIWLDYDNAPGTYYQINYDLLGRMESVTIGSTQLMGYTYESISGYETSLIKEQIYGNLDKISFLYNGDQQITALNYQKSGGSSIRLYGYEYSKSGQLSIKTTYSPLNGTTILNREYYSFNERGQISRIFDEQGNDYSYSYGSDGSLISMTIIIGPTIEHQTSFVYNDNRISAVSFVSLNNDIVTKEYSYSTIAFKLLDEIVFLYGTSTIATTEFVYHGYTSRISQMNYEFFGQSNALYRLSYHYDLRGNVERVTEYNQDGIKAQTYYQYDELNQLVLEVHYRSNEAGYAIAYQYSSRGNRTGSTKYDVPATIFPQYTFDYNGLHEAIAIDKAGWNVEFDIIFLEVGDLVNIEFDIYDIDTGSPIKCDDCVVTLVSSNLDTSVVGIYESYHNANNSSHSATINYDFNVRYFVGPKEVTSYTITETSSFDYATSGLDLLTAYHISIGNDNYDTTFTYEGSNTQGTPSVITKYLNSQVVEIIDLSWSGRNLISYTVYSDLLRTNELYSMTFTYNDQGIRTSKSYSDSSSSYTITYTLLGSQVIYETNGTYGIYYSYDAYGNIISFYYDDNLSTVGDGSEYFYIRNLQGDVSIILDSSGEVIVHYHYDAYGNILDTTFVRLGYEEIFDINPYTYRGYRMDSETGYYYLQSRYYDSVIGRFISIDSLLIASTDAIRNHQFVYSLNNPVMYVDPNGTDAILIVRYDVGPPILGHVLLLIQVGDKWYFTEFIGQGLDKSTASVTVRPYDPDNLDEGLVGTFKISVYIKGDFTRSLARANVYKSNQSYPGYNLLWNNCLDYVIDLLLVGNPSNLLLTTYLSNKQSMFNPLASPLSINVPTLFALDLQRFIVLYDYLGGPTRLPHKTLPYRQRIIHAMLYHTDGSLFLVR